MSLFFVGCRRIRSDDPVPSPDVEAALEAVARGEGDCGIAAAGNVRVELAVRLREMCQRVEPALLAAIQADEVTTQTSAVQFLQTNTDGAFPAARFIDRMKKNLGGETTPATWAQVVAAAKEEEIR